MKTKGRKINFLKNSIDELAVLFFFTILSFIFTPFQNQLKTREQSYFGDPGKFRFFPIKSAVTEREFKIITENFLITKTLIPDLTKKLL